MKRLKDKFNRNINYLRVSITDRCNMRCIYCIPKDGISLVDSDEILTYEEIVRIIKVFCSMGVTKVRITGGEPLVRQDVAGFIRDLAKLNTIDDISMTTNGVKLREYAKDLKNSGLKRVNISLDTLCQERFKYITGFDCLDNVIAGIREAVRVGLTPVKINTLLLEKNSLNEIREFIRLTVEDPIHVRFLEFMPVLYMDRETISAEDIISELCTGMEPIDICGNGPAKYFKMKGAMGTVGFIRPLTEKFCSSCNRLRLTSQGFLKSCLHSDVGINLKEPLRKGCSDNVLAELIDVSAKSKPKEHTMDKQPLGNFEKSMCQIGG